MNEKFPSKHDVDQAIKTGIKRTKGPIIQLFMAGGGEGEAGVPLKRTWNLVDKF